MNQRVRRHDVIRDLVRETKIRTQRELVQLLQEKGFDCTQATVSRDISEIGLKKQVDGYYALSEDLHLQRMISDFVRDIIQVDNLLVVKAQPGTAMGVAAALDDASLPSVVGSISGDDTVLVITQRSDEADSFKNQLLTIGTQE